MKITYIHHSSFLVESDRLYLLFDYTGGPLPELDPAKRLFVFVSHRHGDHFAPKIFDLAGGSPDTRFILSDDIWQNQVPEAQICRAEFIDPGSELTFKDQDLHITAFHSTDEGVAFLIRHEDKVIYHAGDLNNWHWNGEPDEWNQQMAADYTKELNRIKACGLRPDIAFLPLDGRLEDWFWQGLDEFVHTVGAGMIFPMHFWQDYSVIDRLKALPCSLSYRGRIADIRSEGQVFEYEPS